MTQSDTIGSNNPEEDIVDLTLFFLEKKWRVVAQPYRTLDFPWWDIATADIQN